MSIFAFKKGRCLTWREASSSDVQCVGYHKDVRGFLRPRDCFTTFKSALRHSRPSAAQPRGDDTSQVDREPIESVFRNLRHGYKLWVLLRLLDLAVRCRKQQYGVTDRVNTCKQLPSAVSAEGPMVNAGAEEVYMVETVGFCLPAFVTKIRVIAQKMQCPLTSTTDQRRLHTLLRTPQSMHDTHKLHMRTPYPVDSARSLLGHRRLLVRYHQSYKIFARSICLFKM